LITTTSGSTSAPLPEEGADSAPRPNANSGSGGTGDELKVSFILPFLTDLSV